MKSTWFAFGKSFTWSIQNGYIIHLGARLLSYLLLYKTLFHPPNLSESTPQNPKITSILCQSPCFLAICFLQILPKIKDRGRCFPCPIGDPMGTKRISLPHVLKLEMTWATLVHQSNFVVNQQLCWTWDTARCEWATTEQKPRQNRFIKTVRKTKLCYCKYDCQAKLFTSVVAFPCKRVAEVKCNNNRMKENNTRYHRAV